MEVVLVESVKNAIDYIINEENYKSPPEIKISRGSQEGDGYASKTYGISINGENSKPINLFIKCLPEDIQAEMKEAIKEAFYAEYKFYSEIYPAFNQFEQSKNVKEPFNNISKHYKTKIMNGDVPPIVLENLRSLGYTLRDRKKPVDDAHLRLPIKAFARYHAISYAMKDQEPERFNKLCVGIGDIFGESFQSFGMDAALKKCINQFMESLDPILDKQMIERCKNLDERLVQYYIDIFKSVDEYSVISQGDCWSNNMMFLYDDKTGLPIDVKLVDWQCQRVGSPLFDFSYFFYTLATKTELDNAEFYLKLYYDTLSQRIIELGSDPKKVYSEEVFRNHWKKYSMFGLCQAFSIIKAQLFEKDEIPNILNDGDPMDAFTKVLKDQDVYINRMRDIVQYFINHDLL